MLSELSIVRFVLAPTEPPLGIYTGCAWFYTGDLSEAFVPPTTVGAYTRQAFVELAWLSAQLPEMSEYVVEHDEGYLLLLSAKCLRDPMDKFIGISDML